MARKTTSHRNPQSFRLKFKSTEKNKKKEYAKPSIKISILKDFLGGTVVRTHTSTTGDIDLIPGRGTRILHAPVVQPKKEKIV